jgi:hypothetical protein
MAYGLSILENDLVRGTTVGFSAAAGTGGKGLVRGVGKCLRSSTSATPVAEVVPETRRVAVPKQRGHMMDTSASYG